MNWSAYQTRVNEDESAEGRFTLAEPPSGDGDHLPQAANFKAQHLLLSEWTRATLPRHPAAAYLFLVRRMKAWSNIKFGEI